MEQSNVLSRHAMSHAGALSRSPRGTTLGFDFGTARIGVAVGEFETGQAHPLVTIDAADNDRRFAAIAKLIAQWQPALLIVGLPVSMDGREHDLTARCRRFANQLHGRFGLPVELVDERLSSAAADTALRDAGLAWKRRKSRLDATAAQLILQSYLHANPRR